MAMATPTCQALVIILIAVAAAMSTASGTALQYDFYKSSCPKAEEAVRNATQKIISNDPTMAAAFVRLFFHDCFVRVTISACPP
jgi:peroxidase